VFVICVIRCFCVCVVRCCVAIVGVGVAECGLLLLLLVFDLCLFRVLLFCFSV